MDIKEKREQATKLRKEKKFSEAVLLFKELWESQNEKDKWDGWGYAYCLNKLKQYEEAYEVCKLVHQIDPNFEYVIGQFTWSSYLANVKNYSNEEDGGSLARYVHEILEVSQNNKDNLFRNLALLKVMEYSAENNYWEKVLEWADKVDIQSLKTEDFEGVSKDGKKFRKPSEKENYYLKVLKALTKLKNYNECLSKSEEALDIFPDVIWVHWHKADSLGKLGRVDESIPLFKEIIIKQKEWFFFRDAADILNANNKYEEAYKYFIAGCYHSRKIPKPENRWEFYFLGAKILYNLERKDEGEKYLILSYKLRIEHEWKIPEELSNYIDMKGININQNESSKAIIDELKNEWLNSYKSLLPMNEGVIKSLIKNGKAGFISVDGGEDIYFDVRDFCKGHSPQNNARVKFHKENTYDRTKNRESKKAVFIELI